MALKALPVNIPGNSDMECIRKQVALNAIAHLNVESLTTIAAAAAKPDADAKLKAYKPVLLSI
jgi:hypothetical protein